MALAAYTFLHSLLLQVASAASLTYEPDAGELPADWRRQLWRGPALAADTAGGAASPHTMVLVSPGPGAINDGVGRVSLQWLTKGEYVAALTRALAVADTLCDAEGMPRHQWTFAGKTLAGADDGTWRVLGVNFLQRVPGLVGRDDRERSLFSFNTEISFTR